MKPGNSVTSSPFRFLKKSNKVFLFPVLLAISMSAYGQRVAVSGYVRSEASGEALIDAGVISGTRGTVADEYGHYVLLLPAGRHTIKYSNVGFKETTVEAYIRRDTVINIRLKDGEMLAGATVTAGSEAGIRSTTMSALEIPARIILNTPTVLGEPDVLKTLHLVPGVQSGQAGTTGLFIRGGSQDENMFLLDGVQLFNVSHLLGIFSAFTPDAVKKVTLYKGAFPARYGGRVSGVVDIRSNEGNSEKFSGVLSVGALNSRVHLEGPLFSRNTTFSLSGRALHTVFAAPFLPVSEYSTFYVFYDVNVKLTHRFSDRDAIWAMFYTGKDHLLYHGDEYLTKINDEYYRTHEEFDMNWGNTVGALSWNHRFGSRSSLTVETSISGYSMNSDYVHVNIARSLEETANDNFYGSSIRDWNLSASLLHVMSENQSIRGGISATRRFSNPQIKASVETYSYSASDNSAEYYGWENSIWLEDEIRFSDSFSVHPGFRYIFMESDGAEYHSPEPRISSRLALGGGFAVKAAYSRMSQFVHLLSSSSAALPTDLWVPITGKVKPVFVNQYSIGAYHDGIPGWEFSAETYYKSFKNVLEYRDGISMYDSVKSWDDMVESGIGRAYGLELLVRKSAGKATGWVGYSLSKSERRFPGGLVNNGNWFPHKYDRRHNIVFCANYVFNERIDLSVTWTFVSGAHLTLPERMAAVTDFGEDYSTTLLSYAPSKNNYSLPASHSLNASANFRFPHRRRGESIINAGVSNLYNSMNPDIAYAQRVGFDRKNGYDVTEFRLAKITYMPILPSVSYTFKF